MKSSDPPIVCMLDSLTTNFGVFFKAGTGLSNNYLSENRTKKHAPGWSYLLFPVCQSSRLRKILDRRRCYRWPTITGAAAAKAASLRVGSLLRAGHAALRGLGPGLGSASRKPSAGLSQLPILANCFFRKGSCFATQIAVPMLLTKGHENAISGVPQL